MSEQETVELVLVNDAIKMAYSSLHRFNNTTEAKDFLKEAIQKVEALLQPTPKDERGRE